MRGGAEFSCVRLSFFAKRGKEDTPAGSCGVAEPEDEGALGGDVLGEYGLEGGSQFGAGVAGPRGRNLLRGVVR